MFWQLAATVPSTDWGQLNSALYTVTFMAQQNGKGKTCHYCLETDHQSTLAPRKPGNQVVGQGGFGLLMSAGVESRRPGGNSGSCSASGMSAEPHRAVAPSVDKLEDRALTKVPSQESLLCME